MPNIRKQRVNRNPNRTINNNTEEKMDDLVKNIEDLQSVVDRQKHELRNIKKDNYNKEK